jgi:hypothetical protein
MPDENLPTHQEVLNTMGSDTMDPDFGIELEKSNFGWSKIPGLDMGNDGADNYSHNEADTDGTINEKDIQNYVKAIFDLLLEMIELQKHKFNFSNSRPLTGPNFKSEKSIK